MNKLGAFSAAVLISVLPLESVNALDCNAIMTHGMTNIRISKSASASISTKYFNHCHKNFKSLDRKTLGNISVEVFGFGDGDASFSSEKATKDLTNWCVNNKETAESNRELYEESREIYGHAVDAWSKCNKLASQGVQIDVDITPNNKAIEIGLRDVSPGDANVEYMGVTSDGFDCKEITPTGQKASLSKPVMINSSAINISCKRQKEKTVKRSTGDYEVVEWGRVVVHSASGPFQFYFSQEETPTLPVKAAIELKKELSILRRNFTQFALSISKSVVAFELKDCPLGWVEYKPAHGRVVRGIDKSGSKVDPDGHRVPGSVQEDSFQDHQHQSRWHVANSTGGAPHPNYEYPIETGSNTQTTINTVVGRHNPNETRSKNVALLYCQPER